MADGITKSGWFRPLGTRKWHYFDKSATNLCRTRWVINLTDNDLDDAAPDHPDNCASCKTKLAALKAAEAKKAAKVNNGSAAA